ncbi:MAG: hypothetical protein DRQ65_06695 [Gammaproteobacteria bacterium]|nr:MAG: hypothetical protein DRQ65_06695 [Gammaproteobacteria bacterium]RLA53486.1 MAG: hypothetical protein DRQ98_08580 [Gammaproteobacteria bacterium]HDY82013.1 hypothetical protein [Halieaceae bacterium]
MDLDLGFDWQQLVLWGGALSLLAVIGTIIGVAWVVTRLPHDYFSRPQRAAWRETADEPFFALVVGALKNLLGALLLLLGLVMLVTPGQGLLTMLVGLLLMNFPGKYKLERWLVRRPGVLRGLNWMRSRRDQAPFDTPAE